MMTGNGPPRSDADIIHVSTEFVGHVIGKYDETILKLENGAKITVALKEVENQDPIRSVQVFRNEKEQNLEKD